MVVLGIIILPLTFSVLGGFRSNKQLVQKPVGLPNPWVFGNYTSILSSSSFWRQVWNSTFIALIATFVVLPAASMAAFVISRYSFKGRELVYGLFTLGLLFPGGGCHPAVVHHPPAGWSVVEPTRCRVAAGGLRVADRDRDHAAVLPLHSAGDPRRGSDRRLRTARFYWSIMLPLSRPALSTIAVITIVSSWNSFLLPLLVLIDPNEHTIPIGVNNISSQYTTDFARVLAYTTLSMIPALIFYAIAERQIIGGLTAGAVRE